MSVLLIAEHNNTELKPFTFNAAMAASKINEDLHRIVHDSKTKNIIQISEIAIKNEEVRNQITNELLPKFDNDPSAAIYLSKIVNLEKSADGLKVQFDAYRHSTNDIRVMYRIFRIDAPPQYQLFELFPGFDNLDSEGRVIDPAKNNGRPDRRVLSSSTESDFKEYEFNASNLPQFNGFQIKIIMSGTNFAYVPKIRDLRAIASI